MKMTDKTITTFETTLTWFFPTDKIPEDDSKVLIKLKNGNIYLVYFQDFEFCFPGFEKLTDGERYSFTTDRNDFKISEIEMWSRLPEFN